MLGWGLWEGPVQLWDSGYSLPPHRLPGLPHFCVSPCEPGQGPSVVAGTALGSGLGLGALAQPVSASQGPQAASPEGPREATWRGPDYLEMLAVQAPVGLLVTAATETTTDATRMAPPTDPAHCAIASKRSGCFNPWRCSVASAGRRHQNRLY